MLLVLLPLLFSYGCGGGGSVTGSGSGSASGSGINSNPGSASAPTGSAKLTWAQVPSGNIVQYKIYYGTDPSDLTSSVTLTINPSSDGLSCNSSNCTYTISNLSTGTYYFSITSINNSSIESNYSNPLSKTIS